MMGLVSVLAGRMAEQVHRGATHGLRRHVWLKGALSALATLRRVGVLRVLVWSESSVEAFLRQGLVSMVSVAIVAGSTYRWLPVGERRTRLELGSVMRIRRFAGGDCGNYVASASVNSGR